MADNKLRSSVDRYFDDFCDLMLKAEDKLSADKFGELEQRVYDEVHRAITGASARLEAARKLLEGK